MKRDNLLRVRYAKNKYEKNTQLNLDFNILIILDSCRYDFFKKIYFNYLEGKLSKYYSCGCDTVSWIKNSVKTIDDPKDYFFITASPYFDRIKQRKILGKWIFDYYPAYLHDYDKKSGVVKPETLKKITVDKLNNNYLFDKKIVIWFMQPHNPYFMPDGSFIRDMTEFKNGNMSITEMYWHYNYNLEYVLKNVKQLITFILKHINSNYKIIVSSDHGEMFGEHKIYGHPYGVFCKKLQEVPILKVNP